MGNQGRGCQEHAGAGYRGRTAELLGSDKVDYTGTRSTEKAVQTQHRMGELTVVVSGLLSLTAVICLCVFW